MVETALQPGGVNPPGNSLLWLVALRGHGKSVPRRRAARLGTPNLVITRTFQQ